MRNASAKTRSGAWWLAVAGLLALFVWGASQVVMMPLETGEVYPEFSSLRADPLGSKALYESLEALPQLTVTRQFKERATLDPNAALLVLGVNPGGWVEMKQDVLTEYEKLLSKGGRLIIAFVPIPTPVKIPSPSPVVQDRWNIAFKYRKIELESELGSLPRRSALYFEAGPEWRVLGTDGGAAVVERPLAGGTLVLAADTFSLSNQGLRDARDPELIARMIGPARSIAFDENHFGVADTGSVGTLLRKYGLEGGIGVLIAAAVLFMWRSASSFLPAQERAADQAIAGRDAQDGLTSLLRRSVAETDLVNTCFAEWNRTAPPARKAAAVETAILTKKGRDVAEVYRAACAAFATGATSAPGAALTAAAKSKEKK